jgi:hypothetical protein
MFLIKDGIMKKFVLIFLIIIFRSMFAENIANISYFEFIKENDIVISIKNIMIGDETFRLPSNEYYISRDLNVFEYNSQKMKNILQIKARIVLIGIY